MMPKLRVVVIERSVGMMIQLLTFFEKRPDIEVVDANHDARALIKAASHTRLITLMRALAPDAIIVDLIEPVKNDLIWISKLHQIALCPIIAFTSRDVEKKRLGGVRFFEVVPRPAEDDDPSIQAALRLLSYAIRRAGAIEEKAAVKRPVRLVAAAKRGIDLIAIAASAGGTQAIPDVISHLPSDMPPIIVVQHITKGFAEIFANHVDRVGALSAKVARDREPLLQGHVYIAPDGVHLAIERRSRGYIARFVNGFGKSGHMPSADVMFDSVAHHAGSRAVGVILTGMGKDGALGLLRMREAGAFTIGQDEASCLVYGMPKAAWDVGAVQKQLPLDMIAGELITQIQTRSVPEDEDSCC